jgi:hypothetical protein
MAAGAVFAFAMSGLIFGDIGIWFEWLDRMFRLTRIDMPASAGNYEIIQPMDRAPGSPGMRLGAKGEFALAMALCGLTLGFLWWGRRRDKTALERAPEAQAERELIEYAQLIGIGCMVQMLVSPLVWLHYHTLAIPMLIVAFRPWSRAPAHRTAGIILQRLLPALVLLAFLNGPHWQLIAGDDVRGVHAKVMAASFIVLYLTGLWQLRFQDGRLPDRT